jgi:hypothetical protein
MSEIIVDAVVVDPNEPIDAIAVDDESITLQIYRSIVAELREYFREAKIRIVKRRGFFSTKSWVEIVVPRVSHQVTRDEYVDLVKLAYRKRINEVYWINSDSLVIVVKTWSSTQ